MLLGALILMTRNEAASTAHISIFMTSFLSSFAVALVGFDTPWSRKFIDSPAGYIPVSLSLIVAVGFFLFGRANMSNKVR